MGKNRRDLVFGFKIGHHMGFRLAILKFKNGRHSKIAAGRKLTKKIKFEKNHGAIN